MLHPTVFNTSHICYLLGIRHIVLSPGSRNAPLSISFARHKEIRTWVVPDERSAGFVALGIAQEKKESVALCCTSGTALLNYAPAITEAFYRQIPLIVLSADRPPELIDQRDGQTIRQFEVLKNHVKRSVQLPIVDSEKDSIAYQEQLVRSIRTAIDLPQGPIHLNIPFQEPFYPEPDQGVSVEDVELTLPQNNISSESVPFQLPEAKKILILLGQEEPPPETQLLLDEISKKIPVIKSPLNNSRYGIDHVDAFIEDQSELAPDLLLTSGLSVLSKKLKNFLRNHTPLAHLHFDPAGVPVDTFQSNPQLVKASFDNCLNQLQQQQVDGSFKDKWNVRAGESKRALLDFFEDCPHSEAALTFRIIQRLPKDSILHLSNSMPVRYADLFGLPKNVLCRSNRGTSGIDGCTSTAVGNALVSSKMNVLITGDLAFLYDRNAFFHNYKIPNLKIVIMNNQGGGIFRLINGPAKQPELEIYFETRHNRTAEYICKENDLNYFPAHSNGDMEEHGDTFIGPSENASVMELFSEPEANQTVYKNLRKFINERINKLEKSI